MVLCGDALRQIIQINPALHLLSKLLLKLFLLFGQLLESGVVAGIVSDFLLGLLNLRFLIGTHLVDLVILALLLK